jgi:hypothetical protein
MGWESTDNDPSKTTARLYEIHQHACDRLAGDPSEFDRVDAIINLRRVVAQRVKALKEKYQLRELPTGQKPRGDLELLSYFGIIRPFMLKRLIDIRNIVEHQASSPPPTDECLMFADLVWYFLRSTDKLVHERAETIQFEYYPPDSDVEFAQLLMVKVRFWLPDTERPGISATLDPSSVAYEPRATWLRVDALRISRHEEERINPPLMQTEINVYGNLSCTDEQMRRVYELYFKTSHFG